MLSANDDNDDDDDERYMCMRYGILINYVAVECSIRAYYMLYVLFDVHSLKHLVMKLN